MLMRQQGLEMDAYRAPAVQPLSLGQIRLSYNGRDYGVIDVPVEMSWTDDWFICDIDQNDIPVPNHKLAFRIPRLWRSGDSFHITADALVENFALKLGYYYRVLDTFDWEHQMKTSADFCDVHMIYLDDTMARGTIEGTFNDGTEQISFEFYLPIAAR